MRRSLAFQPGFLIYLLLSILALILLLVARPAQGQEQAESFVVSAALAKDAAPTPLALFAAAPAAAGLMLSLRLNLTGWAIVQWNVFDEGGRRVASRDYGTLGGGAHPIIWDGRDRRGQEVVPGVYWVQIRAGDRLIVREIRHTG
jgi:hypothetical protein